MPYLLSLCKDHVRPNYSNATHWLILRSTSATTSYNNNPILESPCQVAVEQPQNCLRLRDTTSVDEDQRCIGRIQCCNPVTYQEVSQVRPQTMDFTPDHFGARSECIWKIGWAQQTLEGRARSLTRFKEHAYVLKMEVQKSPCTQRQQKNCLLASRSSKLMKAIDMFLLVRWSIGRCT